MDVAASEFYGSDKTYDLNFKEEVGFHLPYSCGFVFPG